MFNLLPEVKMLFQNGCPNLCSHQLFMSVPVAPHLHQKLYYLFSCAILIVVKWYLIISICMYLINNGAEHLFICLKSINIFTPVKCLFISFAIFPQLNCLFIDL